MRAFCQRAVNGNGCSANQTDIAGRAAGVNSVIAFRAAVDVVCDPHAAADGHGAVHAHAAGAKAGGVIAGDAAAVHGEASLRTVLGRHIYAAAGAGDTVAGNAAAVHGEAAGAFYPYAAAVRVVVSGDAAAIHGEAADHLDAATYCVAASVGDFTAPLAVGQDEIDAVAYGDRTRTGCAGDGMTVQAEERVGRGLPNVPAAERHVVGQVVTSAILDGGQLLRRADRLPGLACVAAALLTARAADGMVVRVGSGHADRPVRRDVEEVVLARVTVKILLIVEIRAGGDGNAFVGRQILRGHADGRVGGQMIRADGDGLVAAQIDIAGTRSLLVSGNLHRTGDGDAAIRIYAAASSRIVAGDAAAGHGEDAVAANMHAAAVVACAVAADRSAGHSEGAAANMHTAAAAAAIAACVVAADLSAVHIEFAAVPHIHSSTVPDGGVIGDAAAVHGKGAVIPHPYAAASPSGVFTAGGSVAGDAAAVHDEIAILAQIHTVAKER